MENIEEMKPIRRENTKQSEKFADTLQRVVVNHQENNRKRAFVCYYPCKTVREVIVLRYSLFTRRTGAGIIKPEILKRSQKIGLLPFLPN